MPIVVTVNTSDILTIVNICRYIDIFDIDLSIDRNYK